ncbi:MAG: glycosyltransferase, partial [Lachnospiraceae bacterium]|nr:glycosyltransferase [Lachnospiraceae bacterium]
DKCAFYLSHEEIRQRIALNGYRKVKESHTYQKRFAEMLRQIT